MGENIQIVSDMLNDFVDDKVKSLIEKKEWMESCSFTMITSREKLSEVIDRLIESGLCALDLETTSLNTRIGKDGKSCSKIVGICLAISPNEGWYVPVGHEDKEFNLSYDFAVRELARLVKNCRCIYHNFKYDGQVLYNHGIEVTDYTMVEDTLLMAGVVDASSRERNLKHLSEIHLNRPMIDINKLGVRSGKKKIVKFDMVPPQIALYYGGGDAMNTFGLYKHFCAELDKQDPDRKHGPWAVYERIERRCLFPVMAMERALCHIDLDHFQALRLRLVEKSQSLLKSIHQMVGREFDIKSPKQLGTILFEEMKIPYPEKEKTKSGQYITEEKTLQKLSDAPIVGLILEYRSLEKMISTYVDNFLNNVDEDGFVKFQLNQLRADTGRFSASGGEGLEKDGYCGVQCQNIPNADPDDPEAPDIRKGIIARPGYKIVSIDYSGEELRIAANLSREPKWLDEFLHGTADLHTMTTRIIFNDQNITSKDKKKRGVGKSINFLTLYGGGAGGFAAQAKIPYEQAKRMIINFFRGYSTLKRWIDAEIKRSRKRGYSQTSFGRRRPLKEFYQATDEKIKAKGDRCAVNSCIQGCLQPHVRCLTSKGYIPIGELYSIVPNKPDMKVWTGTSWETFSVVNRGECQTARLELENGMVLDCDTRHEVLAPMNSKYGFKKFSNLKEGDEVCLSYPCELNFGDYPSKRVFYGGDANNSVDVIVREWDFIAYVLGTVVGDGYVRRGDRNEVSIFFGKEKAKRNYDRLKEGFRILGLELSKLKLSKGSKGLSYRATVSSKAFVDVLDYLGYVGHDARSKRVPEFIYRAPLAMRQSFLRGYHDTDGCKKERNGYCFHTPNRELLLGIQKLAWTMGLPSVVNDNRDGSHCLHWSDYSLVEKLLGIPVKGRKRCTCGGVLLPKFLYHNVYEALKKDGRYVRDSKDRAIVCKLNKGKKVLLTTAISLLHKYGCEIPTLYFTSKIARKIVDNHSEDTFTLSVNSPLHRFDSDCVISKNTGADVIKIALYRVWKWIHDNGYGDDVHMLMPIHDEIVFEVKEDKLDFFIPEICEILKLKDLVDALGWPVPFDVDAEYGDSFHVDHDYWKEREKAGLPKPDPTVQAPQPSEPQDTTAVVPSAMGSSALEAPVEVSSSDTRVTVSPSVETSAMLEAPVEGVSLTTNSGGCIQFTVTVREAALAASEKARDRLQKIEDEPLNDALNDVRVKDRIDHRGVLVYPIEKIDHITLHQFDTVLRILVNYGEHLFVGPTCRVSLVDKENGEILFESTKKVSVDAFLALCFWLKI